MTTEQLQKSIGNKDNLPLELEKVVRAEKWKAIMYRAILFVATIVLTFWATKNYYESTYDLTPKHQSTMDLIWPIPKPTVKP